MTSLTMSQINIDSRPPGGSINVTVQPSNRIGQQTTGVYVEVNDHYTIADPESNTATSELVNLMEERFELSLRHAEKIIDHIMSLREH